ncbi:hypothetical protein F5Y00DRAFT_194323 [Daldinia vernicosa]|uniref:uncharacterized protein n=1 Tax=Daldinia vernicosa TaxID=114800 RepID=UPI002007EBB1|nr:uncharacterized protein F5Y00DRAFT_194323 [Daldinia vernicosa]KAI0852385.1 hypothetical protein F5Y00DRAFT_194323 [Daldinia vernicosa]
MSSPDSLGPLFERINIAFFTVAGTSFALRVYVRAILINAFGKDDYWMTAAMAAYIANTTIAILSVKYGSGQHKWLIEPEDITMALKLTYASEITYGTTMILTKMSIAAFLLRVTPHKIHRRIIYTAAALTCAAGLTLVFIVMFQCKPVSLFWYRDQPGSCLPVDAIITSTYCYSAFAILTDFTFTLLPLYLIWKLQMDMKLKIVLGPIMCLAFMASLAVIIRLPYVSDFKKDDFLYATTNFAIWSAVEQSLAITAGSLATLRPLLRRVSDRFKTLRASLWNSADNATAHSNDSATAQLTARRADEFKLQTRNP